MSYYSQEKIDEINDTADIVDLVSRYVALRRTGSVYSGLCPFHQEKTPSFKVTPQRRMFHCFGCGVGGGAIRFLMMIEKLSFPEAIEELARRYTVELPTRDGDRPEAMGKVNRTAIYEILRQAQFFFAARLWSNEGVEARRYLASRNLNQNIIREFGLGLAPSNWDGLRQHLKSLGFGDQAAEQAGLLKAGRKSGYFYDFFRNRLMIPIFDLQGRVTAFGGRLLPDDPESSSSSKYINTSNTPVYTKGHILFGQYRARPFIRESGVTFLVEGYFDLISLVAGGINEVTATLGTAVTEKQITSLKGQARTVLLLFDGDEAGQAVPIKNLPIFLKADLEARVVTLPSEHDPDTFIRTFGADKLRKLARQAINIFDFWVDNLKKSYPDVLDPISRFKQLNEARMLLDQLPDQAKQQIVRRRLANLLEVDESTLNRTQFVPPLQLLIHSPESTPQTNRPATDKLALNLLSFILIHPETAEMVLTQMLDFWPDDPSRQIFDRLQKTLAAAGAANLGTTNFDDLDPEIAALASQAALTPRFTPLDQSEMEARAYMNRLKTKWIQKRQAKLSAAIATAFAAGDEAEIRRLQIEKKDLLKK
ncbi:MAG: hypothetical protein AMR96_04885 [Candidatus Adiutrix intracellularis]|nr:MAG: hypothetical protein AMR96_04885 [Candidatus Adiutrix intracellularis]